MRQEASKQQQHLLLLVSTEQLTTDDGAFVEALGEKRVTHCSEDSRCHTQPEL